MSSNQRAYIALCLEGPIQSWGADSQYNRRNTPLMPSKSGIAGMCCAALGYSRGSEQEALFLQMFQTIAMTAIAIPKMGRFKELPVRRFQDFHTIQGTLTAETGKIKECHITNRLYLTDARFGVVLAGNAELMQSLSVALQNPVWGIWLGRKACIPSAPVFQGRFDTFDEAFQRLVGKEASLSQFTYQKDVINFDEGEDTLSDVAMSFANDGRKFSVRRVKTRHRG